MNILKKLPSGKSKQNLYIIIAFLLSITITNVSIAVFAHGGDSNLIHACVGTGVLNNGRLRIITANGTCQANETPLDWNTLGLPGTGVFVANLVGSQLDGSDFRYRTIKGINLSNADLGGSRFANADMTNTNLSGANLASSIFRNNDLTSVNLNNADLQSAQINSSNLTNQDLRSNNLSNTQFIGSNLTGVNFSNKVVNYSIIFHTSNLTSANFSSFDNSGAPGLTFFGSNLTQTNFTGATLIGSEFPGAIGSQTNFTNANLTGALGIGLTNPIWSNTTCPDGTNSDNNGNTCEGHLTP